MVVQCKKTSTADAQNQINGISPFFLFACWLAIMSRNQGCCHSSSVSQRGKPELYKDAKVERVRLSTGQQL